MHKGLISIQTPSVNILWWKACVSPSIELLLFTVSFYTSLTKLIYLIIETLFFPNPADDLSNTVFNKLIKNM